MATYVFLKKGKSLDKEKVHQAQNAKAFEWSLKGSTIFDYESTPFLSIDKPVEVLAEFGFTKELFLKATLRIKQKTMVNPREYGVYVFGKARAELLRSDDKAGNEYLLNVETSSVEGFKDMQTIQELIWSGQIAPVLSYTASQKKQSLLDVLKYILSKRKLSLRQRFFLCWRLTRA